MRILVAGGSGFLGSHLTTALTAAGHDVSILSRRANPGSASRATGPRTIAWTPDGSAGLWAKACGPIDAIFNLAGESIGDGRWSPARKAALVASRVNATRTLVHFIDRASPRPSLLINASAIGFYGDRGNDVLTEDAGAGSDFLASLCNDWETEARLAQSGETRVVLLRTGLVLDPRGGALAKMLLPFRLFAGGPFGSGRQFVSWIHRDDWVALAVWLLAAQNVSGPVNATAPAPVTNAEFARTLGRALRRPSWLPAPAFALRAALGEMAGPLLLFSQRVMPERAISAGFSFRYATLERALSNLLT
ncbi:MAG: TIGR01777 family oxidoreductase [Acidobacteria bacterium]|nr:TIGR01777 family oxidoreductase [Acidobacteriota bacterium]